MWQFRSGCLGEGIARCCWCVGRLDGLFAFGHLGLAIGQPIFPRLSNAFSA